MEIRWPPRLPIPALLIAAGAALLVIGVIYAARGGSVPVPPIERPGDQTLDLQLEGGIYETITISAIGVGANDAISFALYIHPTNASTTFEVEEFQITNLTCPGFNVTSTNIGNLTMTGVENDGLSLGYTVSTTTPDVVLGSLRGARSISHGPDTFDWVNIEAMGTTSVKTLVLENFGGSVADCWVEGLDIGTLTMTGGQIGSGTGINSADVIFAQSTFVGNVVNVSGNSEVGINVR